MRTVMTAVFFVALAAACNDNDDPPSGDDTLTFSYDFRDGEQGWQADYSDYSVGMEQSLAFRSELEALPEELERDGTGFYFHSRNVSDDIFMFLKRRLGPDDGIVANTSYALSYRILFASNAASGCVGIGGAPGESVFMKAGATDEEPEAVLVEDDGLEQIRMSVDKGNQRQDGPAASFVGDVANPIPCEEVNGLDDAPYVAIEREHVHDHSVTSTEDAELWLLVGTDSGFEGVNTLYYLEIDVRLEPIDASAGD
ncbi:MAG: hypothetical protein H0U74_00270 [Bradymonadaceae bacterium]|nr:hypothetical protein [Lujinxingiaceae bacterium]